MKKITLLLVIVISMASCNSLKNVNTSSVVSTATLLASMSSNATVQQIAALFSALDTNGDSAISTTEAIGTVSDNFGALDLDNNSSINLTELAGLTSFLK